MTTTSRFVWMGVVLLTIAGALPPVVAYLLFLRPAPTITVDAAKTALSDPKASAVLVDVRSPEEFAERHIEVAANWPYERIMALATPQGVPEAFRGKRLLLICQSGIVSSLAAQHLRRHGVLAVESVEGGMQAWVAGAERPCGLGLCQLRARSGATERLPSRPSTPLEQAMAVLTGFLVKPLYTLLALALMVFLWRAPAADLAALFWAMLCFFVGENFCAANYVVYGDRSVLFEFLHSYGMVLCFGLTVFALLEGIDRRLLKLSDPDARCAAAGLCRRCVKHTEAPCGLRRVFQFLIPAMMLVALIPLCAELVPVSYNTRIFGTFYNYSHPMVHQVFEIRYLPVAAFVLLGISLAALLTWERARGSSTTMLWSKIFLAAGVGAMGFSFFRLFLVQCYRDNLVWFGAWEEITELLFIVGVAVVLWIFRDSLLPGWARRVDEA
jgi:rhodanese-related sulfurtransferase